MKKALAIENLEKMARTSKPGAESRKPEPVNHIGRQSYHTIQPKKKSLSKMASKNEDKTRILDLIASSLTRKFMVN